MCNHPRCNLQPYGPLLQRTKEARSEASIVNSSVLQLRITPYHRKRLRHVQHCCCSLVSDVSSLTGQRLISTLMSESMTASPPAILTETQGLALGSQSLMKSLVISYTRCEKHFACISEGREHAHELHTRRLNTVDALCSKQVSSFHITLTLRGPHLRPGLRALDLHGVAVELFGEFWDYTWKG